MPERATIAARIASRDCEIASAALSSSGSGSGWVRGSTRVEVDPASSAGSGAGAMSSASALGLIGSLGSSKRFSSNRTRRGMTRVDSSAG